MQEKEEPAKDLKGQGTLDGLFGDKASIAPVFTRENVLHAVTQFVAVDDQVSETCLK